MEFVGISGKFLVRYVFFASLMTYSCKTPMASVSDWASTGRAVAILNSCLCIRSRPHVIISIQITLRIQLGIRKQ